jgi:hypothetical protein
MRTSTIYRVVNNGVKVSVGIRTLLLDSDPESSPPDSDPASTLIIDKYLVILKIIRF